MLVARRSLSGKSGTASECDSLVYVSPIVPAHLSSPNFLTEQKTLPCIIRETFYYNSFGDHQERRQLDGDERAMVDGARRRRKDAPYASAAVAMNQRERNTAAASAASRAAKTREEPTPPPPSASRRGKKVSALM